MRGYFYWLMDKSNELWAKIGELDETKYYKPKIRFDIWFNYLYLSIIRKLMISRFTYIFVFALFAITFGCRNESIVDLDKFYISFVVDSIKIYDAKDIPKQEFMFSPLAQVDKIWMTGTTNPYELDLKTGLWTPLKTKYGDLLKDQFNEGSIWNDPYTGDSYISLFDKGLLRYLNAKDTFEYLDIKPVTALLPRKNEIVIGTANGLFFLDRKNNKITVANNFPVDFRVTSIHELQNDTLIINNVKYYDIPTSKMGFRIYNAPQTQKGYNFRSDSNNDKKISGFLGGYQELGKTKTAWYYSPNKLYYTKDNRIFYSFNNFPEGIVRHIKHDEKYLYILFNDKFVILNKDYVFRKATLYNIDEYQLLKDELWNKMNELDQNSLTFDEYLTKAILLYNNKNYSAYSDLQSIISSIPLNLSYFSYELTASQIDEKLNDKDIPDEFKHNIVQGLFQKYTKEVKLKEALFYYNKIAIYPSNNDRCIEISYPCVLKLYNYLDSLKKENLAKDKFLFLEAIAREDLVHCSCWFGDSYYHYEIVEEKYKELLSKYPESEFADDADFWFINYAAYPSDGESGYLISDIPNIKKFISKYPKSDLIPALLINIADSYANDYQEYTDDRIKNLNRGIQELINLMKNYALDTLQKQIVEQSMAQYKQDINDALFTLTITPIKSNYKAGEDIEVEVELKNNSQVARKILLYKNNSLFTFNINPSKNIEFIPSGIVDTVKQEYILTFDKPIRQIIKLNKNARYWDSSNLGAFSFKKDGLYYVSCSSKFYSLGSNQCKIYIEKD